MVHITVFHIPFNKKVSIIFFVQDATKKLLNAGADPNHLNSSFKRTPLHVAAKKGYYDILNVVRIINHTLKNALD
jgi:hypothetical protein